MQAKEKPYVTLQRLRSERWRLRLRCLKAPKQEGHLDYLLADTKAFPYLGSTPHPVTVANEGFGWDSLVIILVVTVTGWGVVPIHTFCLLQQTSHTPTLRTYHVGGCGLSFASQIHLAPVTTYPSDPFAKIRIQDQ